MDAESVPTVRAAALAPPEVGLKETVPPQVAPAAREVPQVTVLEMIENCAASVPVMAGVVREIAEAPGLLTVNVMLLGDPTGMLPKLIGVGVIVGSGGAMPMRVMVLPARVQTAFLVPAEVGAK
jgi:hypothetical protein